jgi:hypothetical protein
MTTSAERKAGLAILQVVSGVAYQSRRVGARVKFDSAQPDSARRARSMNILHILKF